MKCDYKACAEKATTKGYVYGHEKGSEQSDRLIPVNACDKHKHVGGFFEAVDERKRANRE
ncbi:hypothetical protein [Paenibacillus elgii]|uniref:hypothetical protein n=1 Tax=Paenibacillus elgii TaxID=189691 RepID=UPI000248C2E2|nr:hypothetical protein [Paenibacillus elgii]